VSEQAGMKDCICLEDIEVGWVLFLRPHRDGDKCHVCIRAGQPGKCNKACSLNTKGYGHPIAIMGVQKREHGFVKLEFIAVRTQPSVNLSCSTINKSRCAAQILELATEDTTSLERKGSNLAKTTGFN
jgi:hypothetical protein